MQGIAFFHAGSDILRSKSLDRDSYNSGMPFLAYMPVLKSITASLLGTDSSRVAGFAPIFVAPIASPLML